MSGSHTLLALAASEDALRDATGEGLRRRRREPPPTSTIEDDEDDEAPTDADADAAIGGPRVAEYIADGAVKDLTPVVAVARCAVSSEAGLEGSMFARILHEPHRPALPPPDVVLYTPASSHKRAGVVRVDDVPIVVEELARFLFFFF